MISGDISMKSKKVGEQLRMLLQSAFGMTRQEVVILIILISGGLTGMIIRRTGVISMQGIRAHDGMTRAHFIIDSIIKAEDKRLENMLSGDSTKDTIPSLLDAGIRPAYPQKTGKQPSIININTASAQEFMQLPGIGPSTAEKILAYRKQQSFATIDDIMNVKGIGEKKFEKMKPYLRIGGEPIKSKKQ
jgi:comEA protein